MIFKRLFTPSHQSNDPDTRKAAIEKLSPSKVQDKAVLHELAFNDDNASVTLAALKKLDSFALWQKTAQLSRFDAVKRVAKQEVEKSVLADSEHSLDNQQRNDYLLESADSELIRRALIKPVNGIDDATTLSLLEKVGQDEFIYQFYQQHASEGVRRQLILSASDSQLDKYARKEKEASLVAVITDQRQQREEQKRRPDEVRQQLTLVLSKIKALTDKGDYAEIKRRQLLLEDEFQQLSADFDWLDDDTRARSKTKFDEFKSRVDAHLARLRPAWEDAQQSEIAQQALADARHNEQAAIAAVALLYDGDRVSVSLSEIAQASDTVDRFEQSLDNPSLSGHSSVPQHDKTSLQEKLEHLQQRLMVFPTQQHLAQQFHTFIAHTQESAPRDADELKTLKSEFETFREKIIQMPADWEKQWKSVYHKHRSAHQVSVKATDDQIRSVRRALSIIDNLIDEGRYKAALSRFNKVSKDYQALDASKKDKLQRRFEATQTQIERLEGWQSYLAAPRKPELIAQAEQLASETPDDIKMRAQKIKALRGQWLSLTRPGEAGEDTQRFDAALEAAFKPCRAFYAQQELARENAKNERLTLIEKARDLPAEQDDMAALAKRLDTLKQNWREAGQLEKPDYEATKKQWEAAIATTQAAVAQWHSENRTLKQQLIEQANQLQDAEDKVGASQQAQVLQQQWKTIGHAGQRVETKLWRAFKKANDTLFAQIKSQQSLARDEQKARLDETISAIDLLIAEMPQSTVEEAQRQLAQIHELASQAPSTSSALSKKLKHAEQAFSLMRQEQQTSYVKAEYAALLEGLTFWTQSDQPASEQIPAAIWQSLNKKHRQAMLKGETGDHNREWYTTQLEVVTAQPTPQTHQSQRQDVQLSMMMNKLESGEAHTAEEVVVRWISCGALNDEQSGLAARFNHAVSAYFISGQGSKGA